MANGRARSSAGIFGRKGAWAAVAVASVLALLTAPAPAFAASAGLKPSEAPLVVGQHYFGNAKHESNAEKGAVELWHLPPLLTSDAVHRLGRNRELPGKGATPGRFVIGNCHSTDDPSPYPKWHMHPEFRSLNGNQPIQSVRPGNVVRFVNQVAGGNLDAFDMEVDTVASIYHFPRAMEVLKRGSHPAWSKSGGMPHWVIKNLCHWKNKRHISFLVKIANQAKQGERLCMPFDVRGRTGSDIETHRPPMQYRCLRVK